MTIKVKGVKNARIKLKLQLEHHLSKDNSLYFYSPPDLFVWSTIKMIIFNCDTNKIDGRVNIEVENDQDHRHVFHLTEPRNLGAEQLT